MTRNKLLVVWAAILLFILAIGFMFQPRKHHHETLITESAIPILATAIPTTSTSTTVPPTTTTSTTIPHPPAGPAVPARTITTSAAQPRPSAASNPGGSCYSGWSGLSQPQHIVKAHACWDSLIGQYSWSTSRAFSVMMCESNGDPTEGNAEGAHGLMQDLNGPYDPAQNMAVAFQKYQASGWGPWSSSESCWASARNG